MKISGKRSDATLGRLINENLSWEEPEPESGGGFIEETA